jgi:PAS domain S-box-containing protein
VVTDAGGWSDGLERADHVLRRLMHRVLAVFAVLDRHGSSTDTNELPSTTGDDPDDEPADNDPSTGDRATRRAFWDATWWSHDPDVAARVRAAVQQAGRGQATRLDVTARLAGDALTWVDLQIAPITDEHGRPTHLVAWGTDIADRKAAEAQLTASEARLRSIFSAVDEGFCLCEMILDEHGQAVDYRFLETNHLFEAMTGLVDAIGKTALELVPDLEAHWVETYARVAFGDEPVRFQQGSQAMGRWFDVFCLPVEPRGHFALVFKDISLARQAERVVNTAARRDRFRAELADALRDVLDPLAVQTIASRLVAEHLDVDRAQYAEVVASGEVGTVETALQGALASVAGHHRLDEQGVVVMTDVRAGRTVAVDDVEADARLDAMARAASNDLAIRSYVVAPLRAQDSIVGLFVVQRSEPHEWTADEIALVEDVGERVRAAVEWARAEIELRESEERFRAMADGLPLPVWVHGPEGEQEWVNDTFCEFFGVTRAEMVGRRWQLLVHPDDTAYAAEFAASVGEQREFHAEVRVQVRDGRWRWLESWGQPRFGPDGAYLGHIGTSADVTERKAAEDSERRRRERAELLADAFAVLEAHDASHSHPDRLLDVLVPRFADYATVEAPGNEQPVVALRHRDPELLDTLRELREHHRLSADEANSVSRAAAGETHLIGDVTPAVISQYAVDDRVAALLARLGPRSHIAVPLDLGHTTQGVLMVGRSDPQRGAFTRGDLDFLHELGTKAGVVIASAELRAQEHNTSLRLQQALLPGHVASTPGLEVSARYAASSDVLEVGGDWYESLTLPDGRLLLAVGDVVGHGLEAAVVMGRLRSGLAAMAGREQRPSQLLTLLDEYARQPGTGDYTTVACAVVDPASGTMRYASAGHPPILVVTPSGSTTWLEKATSAPLCASLSLVERPEAEITLEPGSLIVLYTDGLVEQRRRSLDDGLEELLGLARSSRHEPPAVVCERLMAARTTTEDDTVVLCARYSAVRSPGAGDPAD